MSKQKPLQEINVQQESENQFSSATSKRNLQGSKRVQISEKENEIIENLKQIGSSECSDCEEPRPIKDSKIKNDHATDFYCETMKNKKSQDLQKIIDEVTKKEDEWTKEQVSKFFQSKFPLTFIFFFLFFRMNNLSASFKGKKLKTSNVFMSN